MTGDLIQSQRLHLAGRESVWRHVDSSLEQLVDGGTLFLIQFSRYSELAVVMPGGDIDRLMEEIWHELVSIARELGSVFRVDSNQFGILWYRSLNQGQCLLACTRILSSLKALPFCRHAALETSPRIGVAPREAEEIDPRVWVNETYLALTESEKCFPHFAIFDPDMRVRQQRDWDVRRELSRALNRQEFTLHYQPRIELASGMCSGVEALLRWNNPRLGQIRPKEFIPILEDSDLIGEVTDWVLRRAAHELGDWLREDEEREFAFNLSARVLMDPEFGEAIKQSLGLWTLNPRQIVLEVTETAVWADRERSIPILTQLRKMGIKVAIDDFGTGFSTLDYLRDLPVDQIKIDRCFVQNMLRSRRDLYLVEMVVGIGKEFNLEVVAEGAESEEILRRLLAINCDSAQGFAVARAMPRDELLRWAETQRLSELLRG